MVNEITPTYYARGESLRNVTLNGFGFELIPGDAIGILSSSNDDPKENLDTQDNYMLYDIISQTQNKIVLKEKVSASADEDSYLGCIVSPDRQTVYWENTTKPLP